MNRNMSVECSPRDTKLGVSQYHFKIENAVKICANLDEDEESDES